MGVSGGDSGSVEELDAVGEHLASTTTGGHHSVNLSRGVSRPTAGRAQRAAELLGDGELTPSHDAVRVERQGRVIGGEWIHEVVTLSQTADADTSGVRRRTMSRQTSSTAVASAWVNTDFSAASSWSASCRRALISASLVPCGLLEGSDGDHGLSREVLGPQGAVDPLDLTDQSLALILEREQTAISRSAAV